MQNAKIIIGFTVDYRVGDVVYIVTDIDQKPYMVNAYYYRNSKNEVSYELMQGPLTVDGWFYAIELSNTKNILLTSTN